MSEVLTLDSMLIGLSADTYDYVAPRLTPTPTPTSFPLSATHLMLLLLPPALLLPLLPAQLLPAVLLPLGLAPPLFFHPNLHSAFLDLPRHPAILRLRALLTNLALTDALPDEVGRKAIGKVEVWENERLDAKAPPGSTGAWSSRHLRAGERNPWVKVIDQSRSGSGSGVCLWKVHEDAMGGEGEKMVLALRDGWGFIPGEDWRVDVCGLWSACGTDEGG